MKLYQIKSLIVATYLSYYIRLIDQKKRTNFEADIKSSLVDLTNYYYSEKEKKEEEIKDDQKKEDEGLKNNENKKEFQSNFNNPLDIKWKPLLNDYKNCKSDNKKNFSLFFENECDYIIDEINVDKGIAKNRILKENIFLQFIAITSNIPLLIIGKPGSSKSLSFQQLKKSMRGKYSKSQFFRKYPQILSIYFQGSESTLAEDIDNLFERGKETLKKYENNQENKPISLLIFDEIGLSEYAKDNPVKVLHKNLEYDGVKDGLSFVGLSNWKLDSSKLNRVLYLSVPDLDRQSDDLIETARCIAESIRENNNIDQVLLKILCESYKSYKEEVRKIKEYVVFKEFELQEMRQVLDSLDQEEIKNIFKKDKKDINLDDFKKNREKIKTNKKYSWNYGNFNDFKKNNEYKTLYTNNRSVNEEFHGNRDFYNYIKGVCNIKSLSKNLDNTDSDISEQIEKVIERNFGGVDINLDLDFELAYEDETESMTKLNTMLNKYPNAKKELKLPSVFLFKYIYNEQLKSFYETGNEDGSDENENYILEKYKINEDNLIKYDLIQCINGNINDNDARFLLLEIEEGLKYLVYQNIISQNKDKVITFMEGSPFINDIKDKSGEYKIKKISEIQNYCNKEMVLILSNLSQIYPFLYDFFNRNFIIKDDKKYGRICQGNFTEQLTYIHDKFRIIVMIDKNYIYKQESPFLNRFEKAIVKFEELLNNNQKISSKNIFEELGIKEHIEKISFNYNIKNLLINYNKKSIDRLYFYYSNKKLKHDEIKQKIFEKIARTLPQDIVINLEDNHPIKTIYNKKSIFNFEEYIHYLKKLTADKKNYFKFSIIYTFTSIISNIEGINENCSQQIISEIKSQSHLIELINEKKFKNKKGDDNFFIMHSNQNELDKINFIISTLKNNYTDEEIKFIFIVHIKKIMDKKRKEKIYSIPDIDENVDQIFIDNLNGLNISNFDTSKVNDMRFMFNECHKLKEIQGLNKFNTIQISNINGMLQLYNELGKNCVRIGVGNKLYGTAFFCKIPFPDSTQLLPVLIADKNLLNEDNITKGKNIEFTIEEGKLFFKISLNINRITYTSQKYNITIIEIKENDNLDTNSFLKIDEQIFSSDFLDNEIDIYLAQYAELKERLIFSKGCIKKINDDNSTFSHSCNSNKDSIGGPLINLNNNKVIGMHKGYENNLNLNYGILLKLPILEFNNEMNKNCKNNSQIINSFQNNNNNYINELNIENTFLINKINKLEEELEKEKNENKILKGKINNLEYLINENNEKINNSKLKIKELEEIIKNKSKNDPNLQKIIKLMEELSQLKSKLPFELLENEKLMVIAFISEDENFHFSTICKNTEKFSRIENMIYNEYPCYDNDNNIFIADNKIINKHNSLENNGIKNNDIIIVKEKNKEEYNKINSD